MAQPVILVFGGDAVWIRKPFEALAEHARVFAVTPRDPIAWLRHRPGADRASTAPLTASSLPMPFGWASWFSAASQGSLWSRALGANDLAERDVHAAFVTTPHYLPLVRAIADRVPVYYYAADDYRAYPGWNASAMLEAERDVVRAAQRSFFVSDALAARAIEDYGVSAERVAVSMNATSEEFLDAGHDTPASGRVAAILAGMARPIVAVVGAISQRLDFHLLEKCADSAAVGSLVFVGPEVDVGMDRETAAELASLREHRKCRFVGARPHAELPVWNAMSDVALIPYRRSELNHFCSPMRLFDHLASGRHLVATDACDQFHRFDDLVAVGGSDDEVVARLAKACAEPADGSNAREAVRQGHLWRHRAAAIDQSLSRPGST